MKVPLVIAFGLAMTAPEMKAVTLVNFWSFASAPKVDPLLQLSSVTAFSPTLQNEVVVIQEVLDPADAGKTITVGPGDPSFASFVERITNGTSEYIVPHIGGGGLYAPEESLFWGSFGSHVPPDAKGYNITAVSLTIETFTVLPGDFDAYTYRIRIEGDVAGTPDSGATLSLLGTAFAGLAVLKRRLNVRTCSVKQPIIVRD